MMARQSGLGWTTPDDHEPSPAGRSDIEDLVAVVATLVGLAFIAAAVLVAYLAVAVW